MPAASLSNAKHLIADLGYDADWFVTARKQQGITPCIPPRKNRTTRCRYSTTLYKQRHTCRCLPVSPSGYYGWATHPPSARTQDNTRLVARMRDLHTQHDGVLRSPRIWEELRYAGEGCGRHRVAHLMRQAGLQGVLQRR